MGIHNAEIETLIRNVVVLKAATDEDVRVIAQLGIPRAVQMSFGCFF